MAEVTKEKNLVFIKFISALVKVRLKEKNESELQLKKEIEKSPYSNFKSWLLEKIENPVIR